MNAGDESTEDLTPYIAEAMSGGIQDAVADGPSAPPSPLGSAIGSQFGMSTESPGSAPPAPAPTPPAPAPPSLAPTASTGAPSWDATTPGSAPGLTPEVVEHPAAPPVFDNGASGGSSKLPWVAAAGAAVVLLGGGTFFALSALGATGGASSPDEGIEAVLGAMGEEDFVTLAELMEPSERRTLAQPVITELLPELVRLGLLEDSVDAGDIDGVDLVFTDVEYRVERLVGVDDIAHVFLTGGEFAANVNSANLPFTSEVDTTSFDQQERQTITESETPIVFVERDGSWFFSLWFTIAENARLDAGESLPSPDQSPGPIPSESPEAAIESMFASLTSFDLRALIGHMDPEEMAVLYRYSPLFLDDAQAELDSFQSELRAEGIEWNMSNFDLDVAQDGDDATVTVRGFTVDLAADGFDLSATYSRDELTGDFDIDGVSFDLNATTTDYAIEGSFDDAAFEAAISIEPRDNRISGTLGIDGETFDGELVLDPSGECSRFEVTGSDGTDESGCLEEAAGIDGIGPILEAMEDWPDEFPGFAMQARQVDGGWYVSPTGTVLNAVVSSLEELEEGDFDEVFNPFGGVFGDLATDPAGVFDSADPFADDSFDDGAFDDDVFDDGAFDDDVFDDDFAFAEPELEDQQVISVPSGAIFEVTGDIGPNGFDEFVVEIDATEPVIVTAQAEAGSLDTTLRIVDPAGNQVAFNDDADGAAGLPSGFDSQVIFTPTTPGTYTFEVAGFSGLSEGSYRLIVDRVRGSVGGADLIEPPVESEGTGAPLDIVVESGETFAIDGTVVDSVGYLLFADAGDELVITVEATDTSDLDPVVELLFNNVRVGRNDDAADSTAVARILDSQLIVTVQDSGVHEIVVDGFAASSGDFTMTIERN